MSDYENFKRNLEEGSRKFAKISRATLENIHFRVNTTNHGLNRSKVKPPFCQYVGACEVKQLQTTYYLKGKKRRYQLCTSTEGCNQQTEKPTFYEV